MRRKERRRRKKGGSAGGGRGFYWEEKGVIVKKVGRFKAMNVEQTYIPHSSDLENFVKRYTRRNQFFA
jgi:hypothetical protein